MTAAYPLNLRTIIRSSKSRTQPASFTIAQPRRGMGYVEGTGTDRPLFWDVAFRFTQEEAATFRLWFIFTIARGKLPFTIPLRTEFGTITYELQFLPDSLMTLKENGEVFEYAAQVMARAEIIPGALLVSFGATIADQTPTQGVAFSLNISGSFSGGAPPYTYSLVSGLFPPGLSVNPSTGVISGTPSTSGTSADLVFRATDTMGVYADSNAVDFVVGSGADPHFASVVLLLHMNGTNGSTTFTDNSGSAKSMTAFGNAQLTTADKQFGTASATFDGAGDYVRSTTASADFELFQANFTVELWCKFASAVANQCLWQIDNSTANSRGAVSIVSGSIVFYTQSSPSDGGVRITAAAPSVNTWHHVAIVRSGSTFSMYVDGVSVGTSTTTIVPITTPNHFSAGSTANGGGAEHFNGLIDDVRVTKGVARYTSAFTPPANPFPDS